MKLRPAMASMANSADVSAGPQLRPRPAVRAWRLGRGLWRGVVTLAFAVGLAGCERPTAERWQGYIEGEYVYVASPLGGTLEQLAVQRGAQVGAGDALFRLEDVPERTARDQAGRLLAQAQATVADLKQGRRPSELEALDASLKQAVAALELAEKELARQVKLIQDAGVTSQQAVDQARAARDQARERVAQLTAEIVTARLGARPDQIAAAEASASALAAALQQAEWNLGQKHRAAPQAGLVFDTLYREGEWVASGRPVVVLLPPAGIKLRVYVPHARRGSLRVGDTVRVFVDGVANPFTGQVSYLAPEAEFTPPVIYSREHRQKFVYLVEARFEPDVAVQLHPGQPVDVEFSAPARP